MRQSAILITGSNGGIGQFIGKYLLNKGIRNLVFHYRNNSDLILKLLNQYELDPNIHMVQADLLDEVSVNQMAIKIKTNFEFVEKLVNVAGSSTNGMSWKLSKTDFMKTVEENLLTSFLCSKEFIPDMREKRKGRIINFSSIVGFTGIPGASHYCAAKAGIVGMTKAVSLELASRGITVNAIALGYFNAGLLDSVPEDLRKEILLKIPKGRFGEMNDIGSAVEFLLSDQADFYTGQVIHLNGGQY